MRPIYKRDAEFADLWPGVVLTTDVEQRYLNQAVDALPEEGLDQLVKQTLTVERFTEPDENDMQARMDYAWRTSAVTMIRQSFPMDALYLYHIPK